MNLIDVKEFSFTYPGGKQVLHSLSFSLKKGELMLLCGNNGCGKSTLLRSLKPEVAPKGSTEGSLQLCANSQILFQDCDHNIIFRRAYDDLIFPACNSGMPEESIRQKAEEVLSLFGISHLKQRDTATLSGGEKQMLSLAALLMLEPEVLLLDEPLAQLDEQAKQIFLEKLWLVQQSGTAIIIAEHHTDELLERADQILLFDAGKQTLYTKHTLRQAAIFPNAPAYLELERKLALPVESFTRQEAIANLNAVKPRLRITPQARRQVQGQTVLSCENLDFSYEDNAVLSALSLQLHKGEVAFLTGANGAGKTTLLNLLCGLSSPLRGSITIAAGHRLGFLAQNPLYTFLKDTLGGDFRFLLKQNRLPESRMEELFKRYAMFADLEALLEQNPLDLSGGERAKAALFKLLLIGKDIMLLDEPEKHLDKQSILELGRIITELAQSGVCFLVVSHSPDFIYRTAHSVKRLSGGAITDYTPQQYFPSLCETSLSRAIKGAQLPLMDSDEAEVMADG